MRWLVCLAVVAAAATPCAAEEALPVYGTVPAFSLIDQAGRPFDGGSLRGAVWVADFVFTRCSGQCPMMTAQMQRLAAVFSREPSMRFVSISVDPEHDTPETLARHLRASGVPDDSRWAWLTGPREEVWRLCQEGFRLALAEDPANAEEPITHSVRLVLVDQQGEVRGYYDATDQAAVSRLQRDARQLLKDAR